MADFGVASLNAWGWAGVALTALNYLIVALLVPRILLQARDPRGALAWIFFVFLLPPMGLFGFWVLGPGRLRLRRRLKKRERPGLTPAAQSKIVRRAQEPPPLEPELLALSRRLGPPGPTAGNLVRYCNDGPRTFDTWEQAIDAAEHHVHWLVYTFKKDRTGERMRDALVRAAKRGVQVKLLVDDVGSRRAKKRFMQPLVDAGGQVARFLKLNLFSRQISINHRNHRKVLVIDGRVGFIGGYNVGDEYAGQGVPWRDAMVEVRGPLVHRMQEVISRDWYQATGEETDDQSLFPEPEAPGDVWGQILTSGPTDKHWSSIHLVLVAAIHNARTRVWLETPYFIPDRPLVQALIEAGLRGVDVRVVVPEVPDHKAIAYTARSFFPELLAAGVKVYELPKVMLHAKTLTVDGHYSSVGSTNLDPRSFRLNFEANGFFCSAELARSMEEAMRVTQQEAKRVLAAEFNRRPRWQRLLEAFARVFAPLL
ncbi:MAG: cardiolipin synthase [Planctomycetota bacterium]